jgi:hypothetical protein
VLSAKTQRKRQRLGIPLDYRFCYGCNVYLPPATFTKDRRPRPYVCDVCLDTWAVSLRPPSPSYT